MIWSQMFFDLNHHYLYSGNETPINKDICLNLCEVDTVLKVSVKSGLRTRAQVLIDIKQANSVSLATGAWFSLIPNSWTNIFRKKWPYRTSDFVSFHSASWSSSYKLMPPMMVPCFKFNFNCLTLKMSYVNWKHVVHRIRLFLRFSSYFTLWNWTLHIAY